MRKYSKELYDKEVLLKAAYAFTDTLYIHLDADDKDYFVELVRKEGQVDEKIYDEFENELIAQENRLIVAEKTKDIREMIVARSLSSTMVKLEAEEYSEEGEFNADEILEDWFKDE